MKFRLTRPALRDLAEIGRYTREQWGKDQARDYGSAITARLKWLCRNEPLWHERPMSVFSVIRTRAMLSPFAGAASVSRFFVFSTVEWARHGTWKTANRNK
jgi:plasmid stabilization system protein ParE